MRYNWRRLSFRPFPSATLPSKISKNSRLGKDGAPFCAPKRDPIQPLQERPNRRGELPVAVVICDRTGRGRAVYPGQSAAAVAAQLGSVDWTSEPVGVRA